MTVPWTTAIPDREGLNKRRSPVSPLKPSKREKERDIFYELEAWVLMPNHVDLLILPKAPVPVIMRWLKGSTARRANLLLGRTGQPFWQDESFDHWVRNNTEFDRIVRYIQENPVTAGLVSSAELWLWSSAGWQAKPAASAGSATK
jgi:REP element-mobilizing transposase RayT